LTVACGALPPELIEAELFGHTKGAFTSAEHARQGKFEAAENGSLLLDEIDLLDLPRQAKLLRVIETGEFEPVGSNETRRSDARLLVASNIDLQDLMQRKMFRADLYYRLNMMEYRIPPLRERRRDIVPLALDFIEDFCRQHAVKVKSVHPDFLRCLKAYTWPGNVRELKNHMRRAVLFCDSGIITPNDLAPQIQHAANDAPPADAMVRKRVVSGGRTLFEQVAWNEREILQRALRDNEQNRTATAEALGLSRVGLYKKMKKYGLVRGRKKRPGNDASESGTE
jgi:DNA-binding NtrC family response regulator